MEGFTDLIFGMYEHVFLVRRNLEFLLEVFNARYKLGVFRAYTFDALVLGPHQKAFHQRFRFYERSLR